MLRRVFGLCCLWTATTAAAEPARLSSEALSATVPGATIALDTPIGTKIPMRFGTDGLVSGEAGVLGSFLGAAKDRGRWWVANDRLCIKWFRWFESEPRCMEISAEGPRITWRQEDGDTGTATLSERANPVEAPRPSPEVARQVTAPKQAVQPVAVEASPAKDSPPVDVAAAAAPHQESSTTTAAVTNLNPSDMPASPAPAPSQAQVVTPDLAPSPADAVTPDPPPRDAEAAKDGLVTGPAPVVVAAAPQREARSVASEPHVRPDARPPPRAGANMARTAPPIEISGSFRVARVDEDDMLNVRSGPSEEHRVIGIITPRGRGVRIMGPCRADWCPIRHGGVAGWVHRYYLAEEGSGRREREEADERR